VGGQPDLLEVVGALGAAGGLSGRLHGRQEERDEHADDCDHHQELDQGEAESRVLSHAITPGKGLIRCREGE
jgi:hypothetical protein